MEEMTLVERLAEKVNEEEVSSMRLKDRVRWHINAIADELAKRTDTQHSARWLRSQAQERDDE